MGQPAARKLMTWRNRAGQVPLDSRPLRAIRVDGFVTASNIGAADHPDPAFRGDRSPLVAQRLPTRVFGRSFRIAPESRAIRKLAARCRVLNTDPNRHVST